MKTSALHLSVLGKSAAIYHCLFTAAEANDQIQFRPRYTKLGGFGRFFTHTSIFHEPGWTTGDTDYNVMTPAAYPAIRPAPV